MTQSPRLGGSGFLVSQFDRPSSFRLWRPCCLAHNQLSIFTVGFGPGRMTFLGLLAGAAVWNLAAPDLSLAFRE
jgi:hypothetical protein